MISGSCSDPTQIYFGVAAAAAHSLLYQPSQTLGSGAFTRALFPYPYSFPLPTFANGWPDGINGSRMFGSSNVATPPPVSGIGQGYHGAFNGFRLPE